MHRLAALFQSLQNIHANLIERDRVQICRPYPPGMKVIINGFVDNMPEWMTAADTIVTKAGPGTIAESLICNLPILLNDFVPCQEHGNVPWVIDNGVCVYITL